MLNGSDNGYKCMTMDMKLCSRCLYSERHPLHIVIGDDGLCSGCRIHEEKDRIDWQQRGEKLGQLLQDYRCQSGNNYDCIVPVSGARDSHFIVDTIKNTYGMNPLLVSYNPQYNTDRGIRNLAYLRTQMDCDIFSLTVSPEKVKNITRATMRRLGSIYWHVIAGQTVFPVQIAVRLKIPLIIWGCHQGLDQVGMFSHYDEVEMTRKYRKEHDLMGLEAEDLLSDGDMINEKDIYQFIYPDSSDIASVGVRGIYLNNYLRWDSKAQHELMMGRYGYETAKLGRTFDYYNDVDSFVYSDLHDYIKVLKWGFGKVTDHACREIRFGRLTREEAQQKVREHENIPPKHVNQFLDWLGMSERSLHFILDQHRHPEVWRRNSHWTWQRCDSYVDVDKQLLQQSRLAPHSDCHFRVSESRRPDYLDDNFELMAKGFVTK